MTLTISVRVPDGLILAAESLQSMQSTMTAKGEIGTKCPKCKEDITIKDVPIPPIRIPAGYSSTANKLYQITKRVPNIGIATFGSAFLKGQTIESHVRNFEGKRS